MLSQQHDGRSEDYNSRPPDAIPLSASTETPVNDEHRPPELIELPLAHKKATWETVDKGLDLGEQRPPAGSPDHVTDEENADHLAYSTARVSRITVTRICPG